MTLREKQSQFVRMTSLLIDFATANGYELTYGHALRCQDCQIGHTTSLHKRRLAVDFCLFKDGEYQTRTVDYEPLGLFWESIGGSWGGRFGDGNHFSMAHDGMR